MAYTFQFLYFYTEVCLLQHQQILSNPRLQDTQCTRRLLFLPIYERSQSTKKNQKTLQITLNFTFKSALQPWGAFFTVLLIWQHYDRHSQPMTLPVAKLVRVIAPLSEVQPLFCHVPSTADDIPLGLSLSRHSYIASVLIYSSDTVSTAGEIILDSLLNF